MQLITESANHCRGIEDALKIETKKLQKLIVKELIPLIGKQIKVVYYTTDGYATKYGRPVQEFVGTFECFGRNGSLHIVDHKKGVYQNIRPIRIIDIKEV